MSDNNKIGIDIDTDGQVAYAAFAEDRVAHTGYLAVQWHDLDSGVQESWEKAATAVYARYHKPVSPCVHSKPDDDRKRTTEGEDIASGVLMDSQTSGIASGVIVPEIGYSTTDTCSQATTRYPGYPLMESGTFQRVYQSYQRT